MATTDISICSAALLMIGDEEINALPGDTRRGKVCANIYEITKEALFQEHPWRFSIGQRSLAKLVATPLFDEFQNAFQLPSDFRRLIRTEGDTPFKIYENKIYSNEDTLNIEYQFIVEEKDFPAYFTRTLELRMAVLLAGAITESASRVQIFEGFLDKQLLSAKAVDNQSKNTDNINSDNLTRVRF